MIENSNGVEKLIKKDLEAILNQSSYLRKVLTTTSKEDLLNCESREFYFDLSNHLLKFKSCL